MKKSFLYLALRRVYRNHLKKYSFVRAGFYFFLKVYFFMREQILYFSCKNKAQTLTNLKSYSAYPRSLQIRSLKPAQDYIIPQSEVISEKGDYFLHDKEIKFPEIYVSSLKQAAVQGKSNIVYSLDTYIMHDLIHIEDDLTPEELHRKLYIYPKKSKCLDINVSSEYMRISEAAVFTDGCAANYAHFITEVLPRIALFCECEDYKGIPLIIDKELHVNIYSIIRDIVGPDRKIISLGDQERCIVRDLYIVSVAGYTPFYKRRNKWSSVGFFSPYALNLIREKLYTIYEIPSHQEKNELKLYLRRNPEVRSISNQLEIENHLKDNGYTVVSPESLSPEDQMKMFSNATHIVAPTGAALANIVFASKDTQVTVLVSDHKDINLYYWSSISAASSGARIQYVVGSKEGLFTNLHCDYSVGINLIDRALKLS